MSNFEVKPSKLKNYASEQANIKKALDVINQELTDCNNSLKKCMSTAARSSIQSVFLAVKQGLNNNSRTLSSLSTNLNSIAQTYESTENEIVSGKTSSLRVIDWFGGFISAIDKFHNIITPLPGVNPFKNITSLLDYFNKSASFKIGEDGKLVQGELGYSSSIFGIGFGSSIASSLLGYEIKDVGGAKWDTEDGNIYARVGKSIEGYVAKLEGKNNIGLLSNKYSIAALTAAVNGEAGASLFEDGKLSPKLYAKLSGEASVLSGEIENKFGTEEYNYHTKAEGDLLTASGDISVGVGKIETFDPDTGESGTAYGVETKVGGEAYLAKGEVSGGFTLFGIDFDVTASGGIGGAEAEAGASITTGGISGEVGLGLLAGLGLEFSVDWTDFKLPWE